VVSCGMQGLPVFRLSRPTPSYGLHHRRAWHSAIQRAARSRGWRRWSCCRSARVPRPRLPFCSARELCGVPGRRRPETRDVPGPQMRRARAAVAETRWPWPARPILQWNSLRRSDLGCSRCFRARWCLAYVIHHSAFNIALLERLGKRLNGVSASCRRGARST